VSAVLATASTASAQDAQRPRYKMVRHQENYESFDASALPDSDPFDPIKNIALGEKSSVSMGGQLRIRSEFIREADLGFADTPEHDVLLGRALLHGDLRLGEHVRVFVQPGVTGALGSDLPVRGIDQSGLTAQQAFVDLEYALGSVEAGLRLGRHEIALGSARLFGIREGPNVRRSFDGVTVMLGRKSLSLDAFAALEVDPNQRSFDDVPNRDMATWGAYGTWTSTSPLLSVDAYYIGLDREAAFQGVEGREVRHSWGARIFGRNELVDYNVELLGQHGRFAGQRILAWTAASDTGVRAAYGPLSGRVGLKANITSGDRERGDARLQTFNPLFPNNAYFSQFVILTPANHMDVHPTLKLTLWKTLKLGASAAWFWRTSTNDDLYAPPVVTLIDTTASDERFVGTQINANVSVEIDRHLTITGYASWFDVGPLIRELGGADARFVGAWFNYLF